MPKISELNPADRLDGSEETAILQDGITKRAKKNDFAWEIQEDNLTGGDGDFISIPTEEPEKTHKIILYGDHTAGYNSSNAETVSDVVGNSTRFSSNIIDFVISTGDLQDADLSGQDISSTTSNWGFTYNNLLSAAGNHDYDGGGITAFQAYDLMSNFTETYYRAVIGETEFFFLDSNSHADNDLTNSAAYLASTMGQWVKDALENSTATWKIVVFHHPPYTSGSGHAASTYMQLDWAALGAHVVLNGHNHVYERIHKDGVVYLTTGNAGGTVRNFGTPIPESVVRIGGTEALGITYLWSNKDSLTFEFIKDATGTPESGDKFRLVKI